MTIRDLYDEQMRRDFPASVLARVERTPYVTRVYGDTAGLEYGSVIFSQLDQSNAKDVVAAELAHFRALGRDVEWKLYGHDAPPQLGDLLYAAGFRQGDPETLLVADLATMVPIAPSEDVEIRRLAHPAELAAYETIEEASGGASIANLVAHLRRELLETPDRIALYGAFVDGKPVSRAWMRTYPDRPFADLWGGATVPEFRRRGVYRQLVRVRLEQAADRGARYVTVDAMPTSRPILEKLGFTALTTTTPYTWTPL